MLEMLLMWRKDTSEVAQVLIYLSSFSRREGGGGVNARNLMLYRIITLQFTSSNTLLMHYLHILLDLEDEVMGLTDLFIVHSGPSTL
jgi:hypothetical protein